MANKTEDYCQLLGLNPYNEKKYTAEAINQKIDKMEVKWANEFRNKQNDTGQRFKYHKLLDMIPEIRKCMSDPELKRRAFQESQKNLKGKCQRIKLDCIIMADGRYIVLPGLADGFVKRLHWEGVDKKLVLQLAEVSDGGIPKKLNDKVINAYTNLTTVDAHTPVEMLNVLILNGNLEIKCDPLTESSSLSQVRNAFELCEKRVNSVRQDLLPDQDSYISVLRSLKLIIDSDKDMKDLVVYGKCNKMLEPAMETIEKEYSGHQLTRSYIDDLLDNYARGVDNDMCVYILECFCHKKRIAANFSNVDSTMIRCPSCSSMVANNLNAVFCPFCGKNFKVICPQCNTSQPTSNLICIKCGFDFKEGEAKAKALALRFRISIQRGELTEAEKELAKLQETYATFTGIALMEAQLRKEQSTLDSLFAMISDGYKSKKFYSAKTAGDNVMNKYPAELQKALEYKQKYDEASQHVKQADQFCSNGKMAQDKSDMLSLYVCAIEECPDHPTAKAILKQHPPSGPVDPSAKILNNGSLVMKYEAPVDNKGVTFVIYRNKNTLPDVSEETRPLTEIPNTVYTDRSLEPGVEYYYSVYSKRWGVLSREAAHFGPILLLADVDKVTIKQIDGGLRLMYEKPRGASRVRIWRADDRSGTNVELQLNGETVYDDIGLKGGLQYHYLFVAEYETRNRIERSEGIIYSETPVEAPKPIRDLSIKWNKNDGTFTAMWSKRKNHQVMLFSADRKINIQGNMVRLEDIKSWMTEIKPLREFDDGMIFTLPDGAVQYIYPIIPTGTMAIKGTEVLVANLKPFRDVEKSMSNKECIITMNWPNNVVAAKIVISNGDAKGLDDPTAEIMTVRREEYYEDRLIRIPMGKSLKKCINIFAIYEVGNKTLNSRGITIDIFSEECKKVRYSLTKAKSGYILELSAEPDVLSIPRVAMVRVEVGIPLKKVDGEAIWSSNGPLTFNNGNCKLNIDLMGRTDIEHMRLFFVNEEDYNMFRFIHPLYGRRSD